MCVARGRQEKVLAVSLTRMKQANVQINFVAKEMLALAHQCSSGIKQTAKRSRVILVVLASHRQTIHFYGGTSYEG